MPQSKRRLGYSWMPLSLCKRPQYQVRLGSLQISPAYDETGAFANAYLRSKVRVVRSYVSLFCWNAMTRRLIYQFLNGPLVCEVFVQFVHKNSIHANYFKSEFDEQRGWSVRIQVVMPWYKTNIAQVRQGSYFDTGISQRWSRWISIP